MSKNKESENCSKAVSDENLLKVAKEIAVKFIEMGRITPATFNDNFPKIYSSVKNTVRENE